MSRQTVRPYYASNADESPQNICPISGWLFGLELSNPNVTDMFLHLYDVSAADIGTIAVGSTNPVQSLLIPGGAGAAARGGMDKDYDPSMQFSNGICFAVTNAPGPGGAAPGADLTLNARYLPRP